MKSLSVLALLMVVNISYGQDAKSVEPQENKKVPQQTEAGKTLDQDMPWLDVMQSIVIPEINFDKTSVEDAVKFLQKAAVDNNPNNKGVDIVLDDAAKTNKKGEVSVVTFKAGNITLLEALNVMTQVAGLEYSMVDGVVKISPKDMMKDAVYLKIYDLLPGINERLIDIYAKKSGENNNDINENMKSWLESYDVTWPEGSSIKYLYTIGKLVVGNTRKNHDIIDVVISPVSDYRPYQVEIEVQFVAFDLVDISKLAVTDGVDMASLLDLWESGKGRLVAAPKVITKCAQSATVKGVSEYTYPTEFTDGWIEGTNSNSSTNSPMVIPGGFQTRETGVLLEAVPEISQEGEFVNLTLTPQVVENPEWDDYGSKYLDSKGKEQRTEIKQPNFHLYVFTTSISVKNGKRVLLGGGLPSRDGKQLVYGFITARLIDAEGNCIKSTNDANVGLPNKK